MKYPPALRKLIKFAPPCETCAGKIGVEAYDKDIRPETFNAKGEYTGTVIVFCKTCNLGAGSQQFQVLETWRQVRAIILRNSKQKGDPHGGSNNTDSN